MAAVRRVVQSKDRLVGEFSVNGARQHHDLLLHTRTWHGSRHSLLDVTECG
jgi:hypothetical protein